MAKDVIIACDFPTRERTMAFLNRFGDERPYVKIGMELFYAEGPDIVREIKARGHNIFLDTTPERAGELGSDYIVVGRPITGAEDPVAAWRRCVNEFMGGARA